jgi:hypothetical protein
MFRCGESQAVMLAGTLAIYILHFSMRLSRPHLQKIVKKMQLLEKNKTGGFGVLKTCFFAF